MTGIKINPKFSFTAFLLLTSLLLMLVSYKNPAFFLAIKKRGYFLGNSLYSFSSASKKTLSDFIESAIQAKKIKEENKLLKEEIEKLIFNQKNYYREIEIENQRLKKLLDFKKKEPYDLLTAEVAGYPPQNFFKTIYINKGKIDGVKKNMAVVSSEGLVGKVVEVYPKGAKVMLIIDRRSKVGVRIQRTRDIGILEGTGNPESCTLKYILTKANIKMNDYVVTSGLGEVFPEGIVVGYVSSVKKKPNYIFQEVKVKPAVNFGRLEEVFLIIRKK